MNTKITEIEYINQPMGKVCEVNINAYFAVERKCFFNALINNLNYFKHLNLKFKCGYVKIFKLEYGFKHLINSNWCEVKDTLIQGDIHCWLEDADGNVYDHIQEGWVKTLKPYMHLRQFRFEKVSKQQLLVEQKMEFIAYSDMVCKIAERHYKEECSLI